MGGEAAAEGTFGMLRNLVGKKLPYAAVMHRSGWYSLCSADKNSSPLALSGVRMGMPCFSARSYTGLFCIFLLLPAAAAGCVTTATMSYALPPLFAPLWSINISKLVAAQFGVPRNTTLFVPLLLLSLAAPLAAVLLSRLLSELMHRPLIACASTPLVAVTVEYDDATCVRASRSNIAIAIVGSSRVARVKCICAPPIDSFIPA